MLPLIQPGKTSPSHFARKDGLELFVNEMFYSVQGEGYHAGRAAVFIRLALCNLACEWCDTDFADGTVRQATDIVTEAVLLAGQLIFGDGEVLAVLTGGEPLLQPIAHLARMLKERGFITCVETNGTLEPPKDVYDAIDWMTVSPKVWPIKLTKPNEIKWVINELTLDHLGYFETGEWPMHPTAQYQCVMPQSDYGLDDDRKNWELCQRLVKIYPQLRLSPRLQTLYGGFR